jgi:dihydrofolate reductase
MRTVLIAAQSLDGFITRHDSPGVAWASAADQAWFRLSMVQFDCCVMGRATYETVREAILERRNDGRRRIVMSRQPAAFSEDAVPGALDFSAAAPAQIVANFATHGRQACAILGGAQVHDAFLTSNLVDELWITVEPRLFGQGTPLIHAKLDLSLRLIDQRRLDASDSMVLRYAINR